MPEPALWTLSLQAFGAVVTLLALLAGAVHALTRLFPPPPAPSRTEASAGPDPFVVAAIHAAAQRAHPGARVTHIEESH